MEHTNEYAVDSTPPNASPEKNRPDFWKEFGQLVLLALVIIVPFRLYIAQPFIVDGASMDPTFKDGQYLIVDELSFHFRDPKRGEVMIFKFPQDESKYFIKRIIGLPGETISIKDGAVTVTNSEHPNGLSINEPYVKLAKADSSTVTLGEDEYFVLGDNRMQSADSRYWGALPRENIIGRPFLRFIPPAFLPGAMAYEIANPEN